MRRLLAIASLGVLLSACSGEGGASTDGDSVGALTPEQLSSAGPAQREAVEDEDVTEAEYRAGFERFRRCMADEGYPLVDVDDAGTVITYGIPAEVVDAAKDEPCYEREFNLIDMTWQLQNEDEQRTGTYLSLVNSCLGRAGANPVSGLEGALGALEEAGLSEEECGMYPGEIEGKAPPS